MQIMKKVRPQSGTHLKSMIRYTLPTVPGVPFKKDKWRKVCDGAVVMAPGNGKGTVNQVFTASILHEIRVEVTERVE